MMSIAEPRLADIDNANGAFSLNDYTLDFVDSITNFIGEKFDQEAEDRLLNGILGVIQFERDKALARGGVTLIK